MMTLTIVTAKLKAPPSGLSRHTGWCRENCHSARHRGREISSSSDESLSTDAGHLSLKPYMHEPPATPSTLRKVDQSQHTMPWVMAIVDSLNCD